MYETFDHTADLGLRVRAADLNGLFAEAGKGLFSLVVANLDDVRPVDTVAFEIAGTDVEYLLFDWLNELLYTFDTRQIVLVEFDVTVFDGTVSGDGLKATARGEPFDRARHRLEHEVKAITYHELKVVQEKTGWLAELIVDI
jgi:SHS2 domain-containing protein